MKGKKLFILIATAIALIAMANVAFAINRVEVKVTSEPYKYNSTCDKGGSFSLQFDALTTLTQGDQITIDLPYLPPTNEAVLCKDIDLIIAPRGDAVYNTKGFWVTSMGWGGTGIVATGSPVIATSAAAFTASNNGVIFHIYGTSGQRRITVDVIGAGTMWNAVTLTTNNTGSITIPANNTLTVSFLNQETNTVNYTTQPGVYTDTVANRYATAATTNDNTLCLNAYQWPQGTVNGNMDSNKFTFIPSNPQVSHIIPGDIKLYNCSKQQCERIQLSTTQATCEFDNDDVQPNSLAGYCIGARSNKLIIETSGTFDPNNTYQIEAKILVNGQYSDARGVYFSSAGVVATSYASGSDACNEVNPLTTVSYPTTTPITYRRAAGGIGSPISSNPTCQITGAARTTYFITTSYNIFQTNTARYLYIDLPTFLYDSTLVREGDTVEIEFAVLMAPCGELIREKFCVGTFGCSGSTTAAGSLLYPYFTTMKIDPVTDPYWDGIVLSNIGDSAGTAQIIVYEQDGDIGTLTTPSIPAHSMYVKLLSDIISSMTKTGGTGTLGDSRCYIVACPTFVSHGFAMMANPATGESMGYLPAEKTGLCP